MEMGGGRPACRGGCEGDEDCIGNEEVSIGCSEETALVEATSFIVESSVVSTGVSVGVLLVVVEGGTSERPESGVDAEPGVDDSDVRGVESSDATTDVDALVAGRAASASELFAFFSARTSSASRAPHQSSRRRSQCANPSFHSASSARRVCRFRF